MSSPINTLSVQPRYATVAAASTDSRTNTPIGIYFKELYNYNFFFFYFIIFNNLNIILLLLLLLLLLSLSLSLSLLLLLLLLIFNIISLMINLIVVTSQNISTTQIKTSEPSSIQQNNENSSNSQNQSKTSLSKQVKRNFYIINIKD